MLSYSVYKILHMIAILTLFLALGATAHHVIIGGKKETSARKLLGMTHGLALFFVLLSGFGLLARLKIGWPGWVFGKVAIWLFLGGVTVLFYKKPQKAKFLWFLLIGVAAIAAILAHLKPF